jgi:ABC-type nitrate/sulfonate/bicarbonate transport system substrate-binding protein
MIRREFLALMAALVAAGAIAAAQAQGALEKPKITIAVGGKSLFYYLPLTIAEQLGYFKAEGLEVEINDFPGGAKALQALVGGSADLVSGSFEHTINMQAKGQSIEAIVLQGRYPAITLGMKKDKAAQYKSGKDLKGMKIGVTAPGSSTNMFVSNLLAKDGLPPDSVSIIGVGAAAGAVAAMKKGELDAIANLDPVIHQLEAAGDIVAVVDTRTAKGTQQVYGGAYHAGCIYASADFGMRKRCALAQMLILDPKILLMDEPFSALDVQTRQLMENELLELWQADKKSVLFITHDLEEAISLSDRVVVLSAGPKTHPIGEFVIDLPRPRDVSEVRLTPRFLELHAQIWHSMKEEVLKGYRQSQAA